MNPTRFLRPLLAGLAVSLALGAQAQDKLPIRLLVGFPPGGASDSIARVLADKLREPLGQTVIVENKPGVGGRLAAEALKDSASNGLTYMVAPNATAVLQHLMYPVSVLRYDVLADLAPVAMLTAYPMAMIVNATTGVKNAKDYVAWVKGAPGRGTFGTAGQGGDTHFYGLQFAKAAGVDMTVVPYRGNGPLVTDLLGGQINTGILVAGDAVQHIRSGKLNAIGVFAPRRSPLLPDVPTLAEQGFNTGGNDAWMGMWAPAKTPKAELDRMQAALKAVLAQPEVKELLVSRFAQYPDFRPAAEMDKALRSEMAYWGPVIKASGFKPE